MTITPPVITAPMFENPKNGPIYPTYVPKTDEDGNDIAGVRLADVTVPLATYTGWALRGGAQDDGGCEATRPVLPFPITGGPGRAHPRPSVPARPPPFASLPRQERRPLNATLRDRLAL